MLRLFVLFGMKEKNARLRSEPRVFVYVLWEGLLHQQFLGSLGAALLHRNGVDAGRQSDGSMTLDGGLVAEFARERNDGYVSSLVAGDANLTIATLGRCGHHSQL